MKFFKDSQMTPNVRMQRRGVIEAKIGLTSLAYITGRKTLEKFLLVGLQKKKKKKKRISANL